MLLQISSPLRIDFDDSIHYKRQVILTMIFVQIESLHGSFRIRNGLISVTLCPVYRVLVYSLILLSDILIFKQSNEDEFGICGSMYLLLYDFKLLNIINCTDNLNLFIYFFVFLSYNSLFCLFIEKHSFCILR